MMMRKLLSKVGFLFVVGLILISGCSEKVEYSPGLVSRWIKGSLVFKAENENAKPFVLARKYHKTHITTSKGSVYRVSIEIITPDAKGHYQVYMDDEVDRVELQFFARGYKVDQYLFQRTLGIRTFGYNPRLEKNPGWKNSFYFLLKPQLISYITESQYQLKPNEQQFLGDWIRETEELLK